MSTLNLNNDEFNLFFKLNLNPDFSTANEFKFENIDGFNMNNDECNLLKIPNRILKKITINFLQINRPEKVNSIKIANFVERIYGEYKFMPYHNFCHGVSVMQNFSIFVDKYPNSNKLFDEDHFFVSCIACLAHDTGHMGKNNQYYVASENKLALKTINKSVLEKCHIKKLLYVLRQNESNLFSDFCEEQKMKFKETIIEAILGTDMASHGDLMRRFNETKLEDFGLNDNFLTAFLTHCGDLSNMTISYEQYFEWVKLLVQEFNTQSLVEEKKGMKVTQFMVYKNFESVLNDQLFFGSLLNRYFCFADVWSD